MNIIERVAFRIKGKRLIWLKYFKVYTDGGHPIFRYVPVFVKKFFDPHWGLKGFNMYFLGREFNFVFGEDKHGLYDH
jgi:hypothetical protein